MKVIWQAKGVDGGFAQVEREHGGDVFSVTVDGGGTEHPYAHTVELSKESLMKLRTWIDEVISK